MKTSIILGDQTVFTDSSLKQQDRKLICFPSVEEAYLYQLDHPSDVDSYILDSGHFNRNELIRAIRNITFLNEMVRIFITGKPDNPLADQSFEGNVTLCSSPEEIASGLGGISGEHRHFSRVRWPVAAYFWEGTNPGNRQNGKVISISSGGCLISSESTPIEGTAIIMTVIFKNFDFLAEGVVVRREKGKFAVHLKNITSQTQGLIQEIINERILVELKSIH